MSDSFSHFMQIAAQHPILTRDQERRLAQRIEPGQKIKDSKVTLRAKIEEAEATNAARVKPRTKRELLKALKISHKQYADALEPITRREHDVMRASHEAVQELVLHNVKLAISQARRYQHHDVPLEDLVNEAVIGVQTAAEKFDWRSGNKFSTYAVWWIRHMVQRAIHRERTTIRVPGHILERRRRLDKYLREHPGSTMEDAAEDIGITLDQAEDSLGGARVVASLDAPLEHGDGTGGDRYQIIADDESADPAELLQDRHPRLRVALEKLDPLERRVIELRWGFNGPVRSRDDVAEMLQIRPHKVQAKQKSAMEKLRAELEEVA